MHSNAILYICTQTRIVLYTLQFLFRFCFPTNIYYFFLYRSTNNFKHARQTLNLDTFLLAHNGALFVAVEFIFPRRYLQYNNNIISSRRQLGSARFARKRNRNNCVFLYTMLKMHEFTLVPQWREQEFALRVGLQFAKPQAPQRTRLFPLHHSCIICVSLLEQTFEK